MRGPRKTQIKPLFYDSGDTLFFRVEISSIADEGAKPFIFDGPAGENHKAVYHEAWKTYQKSKIKMAEISVPEESGND